VRGLRVAAKNQMSVKKIERYLQNNQIYLVFKHFYTVNEAISN